MILGYHASHEQFSPSELLDLTALAEKARFKGIMTSDHITPWSVRQGQSGFVWSWLGAAMQSTSLPFGSLVIPGGWRYHPILAAQAIATLAEMFPERLSWVAAGSGEFMNEHVIGEIWPNKEERKSRLLEGVDMIRALWAGQTVSKTSGILKAHKAKIWSLPPKPPLIYAAAISDETAEWAGGWADGLITIRKPLQAMKQTIDAFRKGGGNGKPIVLQMQVSWAETQEEALYNAWHQWRHVCLASDDFSKFEIAEDFDIATKNVTAEQISTMMLISHNTSDHIRWIKDYADLGFDEIFLHNAGRNQREFINHFGKNILPALF
jgi:coenzyme F420-dependent glucose-6-phosphate dehydrogenase